MIFVLETPDSASADAGMVRMTAPKLTTIQGLIIEVPIKLSGGPTDAVETVVSFNPSVVELVDTDPRKEGKQSLLGNCPLPIVLRNNTTYLDPNKVHVALGRDFSSAGPVWLDNCTMVTIRFRALKPGWTEVSFVREGFPLSQAAVYGERNPIQTTDGSIQVIDRNQKRKSSPIRSAK